MLRISHPALSGSKSAETIEFYSGLLGMELVLRQPNLDFSAEEHLFFHVGNDTFIAYFVPKEGSDLSIYSPAQSGSGHMDHLAIDVDNDGFTRYLERLRAAGIDVEGPIDRGYERSIYFKDPNDVTIELLVWLTEPPKHLSQAAIIKRAQSLREERGGEFIEDQDIRAAIAALQA